MRVLVDTNILLDFLLEREPFLHDAEALFHVIGSGQIIGYVTATTLTDIFYIARRHTQSIESARQAVVITLAAMEICSVDRAVLKSALASAASDFEDAVQIACAVAQGLDAIVTRDANFSATLVPVLSISQCCNSSCANRVVSCVVSAAQHFSAGTDKSYEVGVSARAYSLCAEGNRGEFHSEGILF